MAQTNDMRNMKNVVIMIVSVVFLLACANEKRPKGVGIDDAPVIRNHVSDTVDVPSVKKDVPKAKDKLSAPVNSSSTHANKASSYDNMRGFDPASEDDMDDNGMSRYMENNDEEGWD